MSRPSLLCVALLASSFFPACSRLFDADRAQCDHASDCAALGGTELVCVDGLCAKAGSGGDSAAAADDGDGAGDSGGSMDADGPSDADGPGDGSADEAGAKRDGSSPEQPGKDGGTPLPEPDVDGGRDGPVLPADCPPPSAALRFCDGFEQGFGPWTRDADEDTRLTIVPESAAGAHALEAQTQSRGDLWAEVRAAFTEVSAAPLWARAYVRLSSDRDYDAFTLLRVETGGKGEEGLDVSVEGSSPRAVLFAEGAGSESERRDEQRLPLDRWTCVELALTPDTLLSNLASLYIDGRLAATVSVPRSLAGLERVRAGIFFTSSEQRPTAVQVDSVAVATERLDCP